MPVGARLTLSLCPDLFAPTSLPRPAPAPPTSARAADQRPRRRPAPAPPTTPSEPRRGPASAPPLTPASRTGPGFFARCKPAAACSLPGGRQTRRSSRVSRRRWMLFTTMSVIWGVPYLLIKVADSGLSGPVLVFARRGVGAALLVPSAARRRPV